MLPSGQRWRCRVVTWLSRGCLPSFQGSSVRYEAIDKAIAALSSLTHTVSIPVLPHLLFSFRASPAVHQSLTRILPKSEHQQVQSEQFHSESSRMPPTLSKETSREEQSAGIMQSHGLSIDVPGAGANVRPPNIKHS